MKISWKYPVLANAVTYLIVDFTVRFYTMNLYPRDIIFRFMRVQSWFLTPEKFSHSSSSRQIYVLGIAFHNIL
ncbi:MAG: hypothetical protein AAGA77_02515, partial [Bacteroidota bacterium]